MLLPGYGALNPYFGRFAPNDQSTMLEAALQVNPTFYALWIGTYDVMGYAISGGEGDVITDQGIFSGSLNAVLDGLASTGAAGAVANIPWFYDIPFFTAVPINGLQLTQDLADQLNQGYAAYNQGAAQLGVPEINFQQGFNYWVIQDTNFPYSMLGSLRQIRDGEYLLLSVPQDSLKCAAWGTQKPIPGQFTLIEPEVDNLTNATTAFNDAIETAVAGREAVLVDLNKAFAMLSNVGYTIDGITLTNTFVSGNAFSLDGLHLTGQGNAFVANIFIERINEYYSANVPQAIITEYPSVTYP
jgi:hypothetical protein